MSTTPRAEIILDALPEEVVEGATAAMAEVVIRYFGGRTKEVQKKPKSQAPKGRHGIRVQTGDLRPV